jgi:hypothetical protein
MQDYEAPGIRNLAALLWREFWAIVSYQEQGGCNASFFPRKDGKGFAIDLLEEEN